jgi:hypothetical protein
MHPRFLEPALGEQENRGVAVYLPIDEVRILYQKRKTQKNN